MRAGQAVDRQMRGDTDALAAYASRIEHVYDCYLQNRNMFYESECRWGSEFWRRRRAHRSGDPHTRRTAAVGA
jgi:hypothetical protein